MTTDKAPILATKARPSMRAILIPAAIYQIILIGPGFSTGREVVEYAGQFGAAGIWSLLVIFVGFAVVHVLAYELARVTKSYNYRDYIRVLLGRAWPIFDLLWISFTVLVVGIVISAVGETLSTVFDMPYLLSVGGMLIAVTAALLFGRRLMERVELAGSVMFSLGVTAFSLYILAHRWDSLTAVFSSADTSLSGGSGIADAIVSGVTYVGYNASTFIAVLFCLDRQKRRAETMASGIATAVLVIVPFGLTYLAVLSFYQADVVNADIPWLALFERTGGDAFAIGFAIIFFVAVVATSVGFIHAFLLRIDSGLEEARKPALSQRSRAAVAVALLLSALLLSQVGIIDLVAQGYTYFAYAFLLVLVLPVLVKGGHSVFTSHSDRSR